MPKTKTIAELKRELQAKQKQLKALATRRTSLAAALAAVDKKIASLSGAATPRKPAAGRKAKKPKRAAGPKRRRRTTGKPLAAYVQGVLAKAKEPMRVKDVAAAVRKAGYKSASKDFYGIVATTLRDKKKFSRAARGLYKLA